MSCPDAPEPGAGPELVEMLEAIRRLVVSFERFRVRAAEHLGLAPGEVIILSLIGSADPPTPTRLSVALGRNASTITATIDRLESAGLIRRQPHPGDRRKTMLTPTAMGRRALTWLRSFSVDAFASLDTAALARLTATFDATAAAIEAQDRRLDEHPFARSGGPSRP